MIKIDLHMHTGDDPWDGLSYTATALIDRAVELGFGAIAITLHEKVLDDERVFEYARKKGLLLIRSAEWIIQGKDVLLFNVTQAEVEKVRTFEDLRAFKKAKGDDLLVIAPHPFFPVSSSVQKYLEQYIELFDAIEHAQVHLPWLNYNKRAVEVANQHHKPVVANSDTHNLWMFGRHYSMVDAEPTVPSVFRAIKEGRVEWHSPPVTVWECFRFFVFDPLLYRKKGRVVPSFPAIQSTK
jgi:predicted metal-dependent phosphoesterase TrpH